MILAKNAPFFYTKNKKMKINKNNLKYLFYGMTASLVFCFASMNNVFAANEEVNQIINLVNAEREKNGLEILVENETLNEAAKLKAQDMIGHNYFAHTSPSGVDPWYWFEEVDYQYKYAGENLAMDFTSVAAVHKAWMKSPTHKENIISPKFKEVGVAILDGIMEGRETRVAVQIFGTQLSDEPIALSSETMEEFDTSVKIKEASISPWQGDFQDEMLVFAEIEGEPEKVEVVINDNFYPLEKLRDNIYMNLILLDGIDLEEDQVVVKAFINEKQALFYKVPEHYYANYIAAKKIEKKQEKKDEIVAAAPIEKDDNLIQSWQKQVQSNMLLLIITGLFLITVTNIWVLEKEEEKLLKLKSI